MYTGSRDITRTVDINSVKIGVVSVGSQCSACVPPDGPIQCESDGRVSFSRRCASHDFDNSSMAESSRPRPRPRPRAANSNTDSLASSVSSSSEIPRQIVVNDSDDMFMRNRARKAGAWKTLEARNKTNGVLMYSSRMWSRIECWSSVQDFERR